MLDKGEMKRLAHGAATECARIVIRRGEVDTAEKVKDFFKVAYDEIFDHVMSRLKGEPIDDMCPECVEKMVTRIHQRIHNRTHGDALRQTLEHWTHHA